MNISLIVESLFSEDANEEYINLYLTNSDLRRDCNKMISRMLYKDFYDKNYDVDKCLRFLNNVVSREVKDKPYLLDLNVIINTINSYIDRNKSLSYFSKDEIKKNVLWKENAKLKTMLFIISDEFTLKHEFDHEAEVRMASYYIDKINNNESLPKEEVEELVSFYLCCGFDIYNRKTNSNFNINVLDYALKNILEFDYEIDEFLYKKLFVYECKEELQKRNIKDIDVIFKYEKDPSNVMQFNPNNNDIYVTNKYFKSKNSVVNFINFFHELRHYEQYNSNRENLISFLGAKDAYLSNSSEKYYNFNYHNLFYEKEADNDSYKYAYEFIREKFPSVLSKLKNKIYELLSVQVELERKSINTRLVDYKKVEDINLLFDETLKKKKDFAFRILSGRSNKSLVLEYDLKGNKRSIFELLYEKENASNLKLNDKLEIYNYLLYEESVSFNYILDNLRLFDSEENRKQYSKYYREAKQVLKHKLVNYYINEFNKKSYNTMMNSKHLLSMFYDSLVDNLRKINIKGLNKDKNMELYREKEEELRIAYKWLYNLVNEIENEHVEEVKNGKLR